MTPDFLEETVPEYLLAAVAAVLVYGAYLLFGTRRPAGGTLLIGVALLFAVEPLITYSTDLAIPGSTPYIVNEMFSIDVLLKFGERMRLFGLGLTFLAPCIGISIFVCKLIRPIRPEGTARYEAIARRYPFPGSARDDDDMKVFTGPVAVDGAQRVSDMVGRDKR